jgi:hypothetical protein
MVIFGSGGIVRGYKLSATNGVIGGLNGCVGGKSKSSYSDSNFFSLSTLRPIRVTIGL